MFAPRSNNLRPVEATITIFVVEPEQNYIGKDMSPISQPIL